MSCATGISAAAKDGGYAELVKAAGRQHLPMPEAISFEAGAAVPLARGPLHALIARRS